MGKSTTTELGPRLKDWPLPGKVLVTMILLMMSLGMGGALGQIIVHDIVPTFWGSKDRAMHESNFPEKATSLRGDLFADAMVAEKVAQPFYRSDKFIFALKFTHIHFFGMSAIFILMGMLVLFLDLGTSARTWLIVLPFIGIIIDLTSVWLKTFIHPAFFWLHIPGGLLFGLVFGFEVILMMRQLWVALPADRSKPRSTDFR